MKLLIYFIKFLQLSALISAQYAGRSWLLNWLWPQILGSVHRLIQDGTVTSLQGARTAKKLT